MTTANSATLTAGTGVNYANNTCLGTGGTIGTDAVKKCMCGMTAYSPLTHYCYNGWNVRQKSVFN